MKVRMARCGRIWPSVLFAVGLIGSPIALAQSVIQGTTWFPIGPAYVANGQGESGMVNTSGRASTLAVNPANPNELWVGTSSGGVWHSTNGGANFTPISDSVVSLAIGAIALDNCSASGCGVIYAGTGENSIRRDTYYGMGLLIGQVSGGEIAQFGWNAVGTDVFKYANINAVILDPTTAAPNKVIYVALSSGVTSSASETIVTAPTPPQGYGVFKSTNQGSSWTLLNVPGATGVKATDLVMDPIDNKTLYAGFLGRGVFKTTDGGNTWCPLNAGITLPAGCMAGSGPLPNPSSTTFDSVRIAIRRPSAANPATLYVVLGNCPDAIGNTGVFGGYCTPPIYKSSDGGNSWTQVNAGAPAGVASSNGETDGFTRYHQALTISPSDPGTLYHGGLVLTVSTNSGASFNDVGDDYLHPDHHGLIFPDPNNLNRMYDISDGGFASSSDGGQTWDTTGNYDLQTTGFQSMSWSPLTPAVIGGSQDNGTEIWVGTRIWQHADDGDSGFTVMDRDNVLNMYDTYVFADPRESTDGGSCCGWTSITTGLPQFYPIVEPVAEYAPLIQASTSPHNMYFGTNRLYESTNKGGTWAPISPALGGTQTFPDIGTGNVITAIAVAPNNANRIYIGYYDGEIFFTNSACASTSCWTAIGGSSHGLPSAPVTRIGVDTNSADTVYATFSGFDGGAHLFKSTNAGTSWTGLTNGLPAIPTNTITVENSQALWVGTDDGVYQSLNSGTSFVRYGEGLPNVPVYEIAVDTQRGRIFAGTHGRGVFLLTQPFLSNFEGWVNNDIWDIPVYGSGFVSSLGTPAGSACTMQLIQQNGAVCASSTTDAMGGAISFDTTGSLVTSKNTFYNGKQVAWGCFNGSCIGGKTIAQCNPASNPITSVTVSCGSQVGIDHITGCPVQANPPTSVLGLSAMSPGAGGGGGGGGGAVTPTPPRAAGAGNVGAISFDVVPTVQARTGVQVLCTASVSTTGNDTPASALVKARDAINITPSCQQASVQAVVRGIPPEPPLNEDLQKTPAHLTIRAPNVIGGQLFTVVHAPAGAATNSCFDVSGLGSPLLKQVAVMKVDFETSGAGAAGGNITVQERSSVGACTTTLHTTVGQSANDIATSLANAFQAPGIPGPPQCQAMQNPRDVTADGTSLVTVVASGLRICNSDPNVGFVIGPKELPNLRHRVLQYAAKFLCGETGEHKDFWGRHPAKAKWPQVADGHYHTVINLHNPTDKATAARFKFAAALADGKPGPISAFTEIALGPDQAVSIDCAKIFETLHREREFIDGFAVVESDVELDVVAVYTTGDEHGRAVTLNTERVPARLVQ